MCITRGTKAVRNIIKKSGIFSTSVVADNAQAKTFLRITLTAFQFGILLLPWDLDTATHAGDPEPLHLLEF